MEFEAYNVALIPFLMAVVQVAKKLGLPKKAVPVFALILGNLLGFIYLAPGEPDKAILWGTSIALSAIGAYSGAKNTLEMRKK